MDESAELAQMFKSLGDPTRLRIFSFLRTRCCAVALGDQGNVHTLQGPTVGEVCCQVTGLEKINSTISFHLKEMRLAGLIEVEKRGKFMVCNVNRDAVAKLAKYLGEDEAPTGCC